MLIKYIRERKKKALPLSQVYRKLSQFRAFELSPRIMNICHMCLALLICDTLLVYQDCKSVSPQNERQKLSSPASRIPVELTWLLPARSALAKLELKAMR